VKLRKLTVALVAALALVGLAACSSNAGTAAVVDGHKISESDVGQYLQPNAQPFSNGQNKVVPKSLALNTLIAERIYDKALKENGGAPSDAELNQAQQQALQGQKKSDLRKQVVKSGFTKSFVPVYLRVQSLPVLLNERVQNGQDQKKIVASLDADVDVNASYGTWNSDGGLDNNATGGVPSFVTFDDAAQSSLG
jgi:hypothetical protein